MSAATEAAYRLLQTLPVRTHRQVERSGDKRPGGRALAAETARRRACIARWDRAKVPIRDMAKRLEISHQAVRAHLIALGLRKVKKHG